MNKPRIIAFYLPQFHPTPDNDKWWGKGFTEWTNVAKAKPLFKGHYQPHIPADLGFYDLRLSEVREAQAELAREAGVEGFCYYHYWFGNGKEELERPFNEVLESGKPDFPFCLCWANESWHSKFWNRDGSVQKKLLIEQIYPGKQDEVDHFYRLLPAFKDPRYIRIDNHPVFFIYKPESIPCVSEFIRHWNTLAKSNGIEKIHFVAHIWGYNVCDEKIDELRNVGFDGVTTISVWNAAYVHTNIFARSFRKAKSMFLGLPRVRDYEKVSRRLFFSCDRREDVYPTILPNWDHSPRSKGNALILVDSQPRYFKQQVVRALSLSQNKRNPIIMLKSWNEWGEGNYMEPDLKFGKGYIEALKNAIEEWNSK